MKEKNSLENLLANGITQLNLSMTEEQRAVLFAYMDLLIKWNRTYNLTSISLPREIITNHLLDSLTIAPYLSGERIIDVGSGAGLPGLPLAVYYPNKEFVLLDSNGKKTRFLIQAVNELKISNVSIVNERIEKFFPKQCFNNVISRALCTATDFLEKTQHLCCIEGCYLAMKGRCPTEELSAVDKKFILQNLYRLNIPGLNKQRHLLCFTNAAQGD